MMKPIRSSSPAKAPASRTEEERLRAIFEEDRYLLLAILASRHATLALRKTFLEIAEGIDECLQYFTERLERGEYPTKKVPLSEALLWNHLPEPSGTDLQNASFDELINAPSHTTVRAGVRELLEQVNPQAHGVIRAEDELVQNGVRRELVQAEVADLLTNRPRRGWFKGDDGAPQPDLHVRAAVNRLRELDKQGVHSLQELEKILKSEGILARNKAAFTQQQIRTLRRREI
jgi:hypothetical protein